MTRVYPVQKVLQLTSIGAEAHSSAGLSTIANSQDEQLPLYMQLLAVGYGLVPAGTGALRWAGCMCTVCLTMRLDRVYRCCWLWFADLHDKATR